MIPRAFVAITVCAGVAAGALGAACSSSSANSAFGTTTGTGTYNSGPPDASDASVQSPDASAEATQLVDASSTTKPIQGSPLCNATMGSGLCFPDDPATAGACGTAPDGGAYDPAANYDGGVLGCHVVNEGGLPPTPAPACLTAGTGADGAECEASADCMATQECVGTGVCRRYCCLAPCDSQDFCDIQLETQNPTLVVPVCLPVRPCGLLDLPTDAGPCPMNETCAPFVSASGAGLTTCVDVGQGHAGDSCDSQHCAAGLVCVGMWGEKRCYTLCHTDGDGGSECPATQTCTGGLPLFPNPLVGLCQQISPDF